MKSITTEKISCKKTYTNHEIYLHFILNKNFVEEALDIYLFEKNVLSNTFIKMRLSNDFYMKFSQFIVKFS
jgi:hypothetical protein